MGRVDAYREGGAVVGERTTGETEQTTQADLGRAGTTVKEGVARSLNRPFEMPGNYPLGKPPALPGDSRSLTVAGLHFSHGCEVDMMSH